MEDSIHIIHNDTVHTLKPTGTKAGCFHWFVVRAGKGSFWGRAVGLFGSGVWGCARRLPWMQRVGETFSFHSEWGRGVCRGAGPGTDGGCVFPWFFPGGGGGGGLVASLGFEVARVRP